MVLLTENFPPYNMAINGKNFAQEDNIDGIAVDIVREMFKRAGIKYSLTLRFPWDRIYKLALEKPGYGVFVTARLAEREDKFKWVGPIGPDDWVLLAKGDSPITLAAWTRRRNTGSAPTRAMPSPSSSARTVSRPTWRYATRKTRRSWSGPDRPLGQRRSRRALPGQAGRRDRPEDGAALHSDQLYLALNRETPDEVVQKLQAALDGMRKEGFVEDILNSYL